MFVCLFVAGLAGLALDVSAAGQTWLAESCGAVGPQDSWSTGEQYLTALYFAVSSIATMGYGDIVPISHAERAYVMILVRTRSRGMGPWG